MDCPFCEGETRVFDSRATPSGTGVVRRRECRICGGRFRTTEEADVTATEVRRFRSAVSEVVKRDGRRREALDEEKVRAGITAALDKSTGRVPQEVIDDIVTRVVRTAVTTGEDRRREISTQTVGQIVLEELRRSKIIVAVSRLRFAIGFLRFRTTDDVGAWLGDPSNWPTNETFPASDEPHLVVTVRKRLKDDERWEQEKLARSIAIAARSISDDKMAVDRFAAKIAHAVQWSLRGHSLVLSEQISTEVMRVLRERGDLVPYLRYATAVKRMRNLREFWVEYRDVVAESSGATS